MSLCGQYYLDVTNLRITLPNLEAVLAQFRVLSGLRVKYAKSKVLNVSLPPDVVATFKAAFPYPWQAAIITLIWVFRLQAPSRC